MNYSKLIATALLALAGTSQAAQQSVSGTQGFVGSLSDYGFAYTVTWDSPVMYELTTSGYGVQYSVGGADHAFVSAAWSLLPSPSANFSELSKLDLKVTASFAFINLATGNAELPAATYASEPKPSVFAFGFNVIEQCAAPSGPIQLRFSNPKCSFSSSLTTSGALPGGSFAKEAEGTADLLVQAGNYLQASDNPECASFSCMTPGHDVIGRNGVYFVASAGAVPEPTTWAMLLVGVGALAAMRRRRA